MLFLYIDGITSPISIGEFCVLLNADRITSPMNIGEIWCSFQYRQNYFADEHRRDLWFLYTDRITSPMIIDEKAVLYTVVKEIFTY